MINHDSKQIYDLDKIVPIFQKKPKINQNL